MINEIALDNEMLAAERKLKEVLIHTESLDREAKELLSELKVTPQQLTAFVNNKEHFTEKNWQELLALRSQLDERLRCQLAQVRNPKELKKKRAGLQDIQRNWICVR